MWTRNNDVSNWNMLKHFIYSSFSKSTTSSLCSLYYRYSSKVSSFFCILSFLVIAISIDQTFYSATHYLAAVWLDSRHDLNSLLKIEFDRSKLIYDEISIMSAKLDFIIMCHHVDELELLSDLIDDLNMHSHDHRVAQSVILSTVIDNYTEIFEFCISLIKDFYNCLTIKNLLALSM